MLEGTGRKPEREARTTWGYRSISSFRMSALSRRRLAFFEDEDLVPVEADLLVLDVPELAEDDERPDDQDDRDRELEDDEEAPDEAALHALSQFPLEDRRRYEGGDKERWVGPGQKGDPRDKAERRGRHAGRGQKGDSSICFPGELVEERQGQPDEKDGEEEGDQAEDQGLEQELS